jgi:hypothetical protein
MDKAMGYADYPSCTPGAVLADKEFYLSLTADDSDRARQRAIELLKRSVGEDGPQPLVLVGSTAICGMSLNL